MAGGLRTGWCLGCGVTLALFVACGETSGGSPQGTASGGSAGAGKAPAEPGGAPAAGGTGHADAGEASEGGAPESAEPRGGAASGGAPGGSPSGGAVAVTIVPDGCDATSPIVAEKHCSLDLSCDDRRLSVACTNDRGLWTCSCSGSETSVTYEIPDLASAATCELAAKACADPSSLTGEETCTRSGSHNDFECSLRDECETWHELDGRRLRTRRHWQATCKACPNAIDAGAPGLSCCRCSDEPPRPGKELADYRLADYDLASGCDFLAELCQPASFEPAGELACENLELAVGVDIGCRMVTRCFRPIELETGTELTLGGEYYSTCSYVSDGVTSCRCGDADNQVGYELDWGLPHDDIATCRAVDAACTGAAPPELEGEPECTPYFETLTSDSCAVRRECEEPALVGGTAASLRTSSSARCERKEPGSKSWTCQCTSANAATFALESGDVESTCAEAVAECAGLSPS